MPNDDTKNPLDRSQRLLIAAVLAAAAGYSAIIWFTGGGPQDAFGAVALGATALYVALCRVQSTANLLLQLQSERKPPLLAVVLHFTALLAFLVSLAYWLKK